MELPKAERLGEMPAALRAWITCLLHNLDEDAMSQITHPPVQEALRHLQELSADEELRWAALQHDIAVLDERTAINRATRKGEEMGLKQGLETGRHQAAALTLTALLQHKFSDIPAWAQARIATADFAELQRWTLNVLDADRIEAVFDPSS